MTESPIVVTSAPLPTGDVGIAPTGTGIAGGMLKIELGGEADGAGELEGGVELEGWLEALGAFEDAVDGVAVIVGCGCTLRAG